MTEEATEEKKKRGRPANPKGAISAVERQATYRKNKLKEGIELSIFLTHKQAAILRAVSKRAGKTQSETVGELLENSTQISPNTTI